MFFNFRKISRSWFYLTIMSCFMSRTIKFSFIHSSVVVLFTFLLFIAAWCILFCRFTSNFSCKDMENMMHIRRLKVFFDFTLGFVSIIAEKNVYVYVHYLNKLSGGAQRLLSFPNPRIHQLTFLSKPDILADFHIVFFSLCKNLTPKSSQLSV